MDNWLHNLPVVWMAVVVFGATFLVAAMLDMVVIGLAVGESSAYTHLSLFRLACCRRSASFSAFFVAFTAAQVWNDNGQANATIDREASALRSVVILAASFLPASPRCACGRWSGTTFPGSRKNVGEWPMMAEGTATC